MKTFNRVCVGLLSSLLLTAGFARAAERLDPLSQQLSGEGIAVNSLECAVSPCASPCLLVDRAVMNLR